MVNIEFNYDDFKITSVKREDIDELNKWILLNDKCNEDAFSLDRQLFYRRFLEYYLTEEELFIKIEKNNEICGVFKGRFELEEKSELFIWLYIIDSKFRNKGLGNEILKEILKYFKKFYYIELFKVGVNVENKKAINFWNKAGFTKLRISKDFFEDTEENTADLIILTKLA
ncbi:GNAT family N-acetyltransferase [Clostridium uliginosum]|uniref:Ribosomal protein S18 acetylase RimI n=1 Tax=Clostridium uliginosum TaxID=119641 RepID=A0A1I1I672_9CLOT|nr:GNAT family N-acetyltransferase [Clostridium uliginosum]SFC31525.1 Ribosomal protein S18 acetylase RimI [Clostridium uliginosum]